MPAPKGNQFWKLRAKHGRDKLFASPELLWEAACEYFTWCDENPWTRQEWVGKDAYEVQRNLPRPYTIQGLCLYLDANVQYFNDFERGLKEKPDQGFSTIISRIRETIFTQKYEGAAVGIFNHNIIARDLGLVDKSESKADVKVSAPILQFGIAPGCEPIKAEGQDEAASQAD